MPELSKLNYIVAGSGGTFKPLVGSKYITTAADTDAIFADLVKNNKHHILLYFHGGLVNEVSGMATAEVVTTALQSDTLHVISFIWETGLMETIGDNLNTIRKTTFFQKLVEKIIKVAGSKLGIAVDTVIGLRGVSEITYPEIQAQLATPAPFDNYQVNMAARSPNVISGNDSMLSDEIEVMIETELLGDDFFTKNPLNTLNDQELEMIDPVKLINIPTPDSRGILSIAGLIKSAATLIFEIIKRFKSGHDHGFYPTVVEEILREIYISDVGTQVWGDMKTKAQEMWNVDPAGTDPKDMHVGGYFIKQLQAFAKGKADVTIDLAGHSAGAIAICFFLEAFYKAGVNASIRNTVFMAPACRSDLFYTKVVQPNTAIGKFRMFAMDDHYECLDRCVPFIYTRSLLYMISGILEGKDVDCPILGMQRYLLDHPPYAGDTTLQAIINFLNSSPNRTVFAVTDRTPDDGLRCIAEHHGGFADPKVLTLESIEYILTH